MSRDPLLNGEEPAPNPTEAGPARPDRTPYLARPNVYSPTTCSTGPAPDPRQKLRARAARLQAALGDAARSQSADAFAKVDEEAAGFFTEAARHLREHAAAIRRGMTLPAAARATLPPLALPLSVTADAAEEAALVADFGAALAAKGASPFELTDTAARLAALAERLADYAEADRADRDNPGRKAT